MLTSSKLIQITIYFNETSLSCVRSVQDKIEYSMCTVILRLALPHRYRYRS